jgi:hypothetical protein
MSCTRRPGFDSQSGFGVTTAGAGPLLKYTTYDNFYAPIVPRPSACAGFRLNRYNSSGQARIGHMIVYIVHEFTALGLISDDS